MDAPFDASEKFGWVRSAGLGADVYPAPSCGFTAPRAIMGMRLDRLHIGQARFRALIPPLVLPIRSPPVCHNLRRPHGIDRSDVISDNHSVRHRQPCWPPFPAGRRA